jgi:hypothetical protein
LILLGAIIKRSARQKAIATPNLPGTRTLGVSSNSLSNETTFQRGGKKFDVRNILATAYAKLTTLNPSLLRRSNPGRIRSDSGVAHLSHEIPESRTAS